MIYSNPIFAPLTVFSIHLSDLISFHLLKQDAMCPALKLSYDSLEDSLISLTCKMVLLALLLSVTLMLWVRPWRYNSKQE